MTSNAPPCSPSSPDGVSVPGRLVVVSGPSGVGKSTILRRLAERVPYVFSVSATTRPPRPGEIDGVHYHFVERSRFEEMIASGDLVEWAEYGGELYGTPISAIEDARRQASIVVLDIELEGARQVRALFPDALLVWVAPPSFEDLEARLRIRGDTDVHSMERRLQRARRDMRLAPALFDQVVVNDDLGKAVDTIAHLVADAGSGSTGC